MFILEDLVASGPGQDVELGVQVLVDSGDAGVAEDFISVGSQKIGFTKITVRFFLNLLISPSFYNL